MIRSATEQDMPAILEIERTSFNVPHWSEPDFRNAMETKKGFLSRVLLVEECGGAIRGVAVASALTALFPVEAEIQNLAVSAEHRRCGVGRELLKALLAWAAMHEVAVIRLEARVSNAGALRLYRELGFADAGTRRAYYQNPVEDAVLMEKQLGGTGSAEWLGVR